MAKYKLVKVGEATNHISKKGNKTIKLTFYDSVWVNIAKHDFENGIYIMSDTGAILCPMPNEVQPIITNRSRTETKNQSSI